MSNTNDYKLLKDFVMVSRAPLPTEEYYKYNIPSKQEVDVKLEYDMDEEDFAWLELFNEQRINGCTSLSAVSYDIFERLMDRFEKECFFQISKEHILINSTNNLLEHTRHSTPRSYNNFSSQFCSICLNNSTSDVNPLIYCNMCKILVHKKCYGISLEKNIFCNELNSFDVKDSDTQGNLCRFTNYQIWLCQRCLNSPSNQVKCIICPNKGFGALKKTLNDSWAHVTCVQWLPELSFGDERIKEPILGEFEVAVSRFTLTCFICKEKNKGACLTCQQPSCHVSYHPTCAQLLGLVIKIELIKDENGLFKKKLTSFCILHFDGANNFNNFILSYLSEFYNFQNGSTLQLYKDDLKSDDETNEYLFSDSNIIDQKKIIFWKERINDVRKVLSLWRDANQVIFKPVINVASIGKITQLAREFGIEKCESFVSRLHCYWTLKRQSRNGQPLISSRKCPENFKHSYSSMVYRADHIKNSLNNNYFNEKISTEVNNDKPIEKSIKLLSNRDKKINSESCVRYSSYKQEKECLNEFIISEKLGFFKYLYHDLDRVRLLIELIQKREQIKFEKIKLYERQILLEFDPIYFIMCRVLEQLELSARDTLQNMNKDCTIDKLKEKIETKSYDCMEDFVIDIRKLVDLCPSEIAKNLNAEIENMFTSVINKSSFKYSNYSEFLDNQISTEMNSKKKFNILSTSFKNNTIKSNISPVLKYSNLLLKKKYIKLSKKKKSYFDSQLIKKNPKDANISQFTEAIETNKLKKKNYKCIAKKLNNSLIQKLKKQKSVSSPKNLSIDVIADVTDIESKSKDSSNKFNLKKKNYLIKDSSNKLKYSTRCKTSSLNNNFKVKCNNDFKYQKNNSKFNRTVSSIIEPTCIPHVIPSDVNQVENYVQNKLLMNPFVPLGLNISPSCNYSNYLYKNQKNKTADLLSLDAKSFMKFKDDSTMRTIKSEKNKITDPKAINNNIIDFNNRDRINETIINSDNDVDKLLNIPKKINNFKRIKEKNKIININNEEFSIKKQNKIKKKLNSENACFTEINELICSKNTFARNIEKIDSKKHILKKRSKKSSLAPWDRKDLKKRGRPKKIEKGLTEGKTIFTEREHSNVIEQSFNASIDNENLIKQNEHFYDNDKVCKLDNLFSKIKNEKICNKYKPEKTKNLLNNTINDEITNPLRDVYNNNNNNNNIKQTIRDVYNNKSDFGSSESNIDFDKQHKANMKTSPINEENNHIFKEDLLDVNNKTDMTNNISDNTIEAINVAMNENIDTITQNEELVKKNNFNENIEANIDQYDINQEYVKDNLFKDLKKGNNLTFTNTERPTARENVERIFKSENLNNEQFDLSDTMNKDYPIKHENNNLIFKNQLESNLSCVQFKKSIYPITNNEVETDTKKIAKNSKTKSSSSEDKMEKRQLIDKSFDRILSDEETSDYKNDLKELKPFDLVWIKESDQNWQTGIFVNKEDVEITCSKYHLNKISNNILEELESNQELYLIYIFNLSIWKLVEREHLYHLDSNSEMDKSRILENKNNKRRLIMQEAYNQALNFKKNLFSIEQEDINKHNDDDLNNKK